MLAAFLMAARRRVHAGGRERAAFTMIELMVVVAIMGVVLGMGIPIAYRVTHKAPMVKAVAAVFELCSEGRRRAILQSTKVELVFDAKGGMSLGNAPSRASGPKEEAPPSLESAPPTTTVSSAPGGAGQLPENVAIEKLFVNGVDCMDYGEARVRFFPNGTCDELQIQLRSDRNDRVEITLEVTTGLASAEYDWTKFRLR